MFTDKVVVVTGGVQGIGKCICDMFRAEGAHVCVIDVQENDFFTGDLADKETLERFVEKVVAGYGHVDFLINNAAPLFKGIEDCSYEEFEYAQRVGVTAPYYLTKLFLPYFAAVAPQEAWKRERALAALFELIVKNTGFLKKTIYLPQETEAEREEPDYIQWRESVQRLCREYHLDLAVSAE